MALLSEVAKTGRRFRRKSNTFVWYYLEGKKILITDHGVAEIDAEMLVATDWEAEPKTCVVTQDELIDIAKSLANNPICHQRKLSPVEMMKLVIVELGLNDL